MEGKAADLLKQDRKVIESQIIGYIHFLLETKKYGRYFIGTGSRDICQRKKLYRWWRRKSDNVKLPTTIVTLNNTSFILF